MMYRKILKESAKQLTLLAVENCSESQGAIGKNLSPFFKHITYVSNTQEALWLCKSEKFDLILIDIDTLGGDPYRFIDDLQKQDMFQAIAVCSSRGDDAELLLKLLNSAVAGFIQKSSEVDETYKILSHICTRLLDRSVMVHYVEEMDKLHDTVLRKCYTCSVKSSLVSGGACKTDSAFVPAESVFAPPKAEVAVEDDDFMFFPESTDSTPAEVVDNSLYEDYFSFLEFDDREELHDLLSDVDSSLLSAFSENGSDSQFISRLGSSLMRYGNVLLHYQFFSDMGTSILEFGKTISDKAEMIAERSSEFEMLISGFCSGLQTYMHEVWDKNSDNPKFFNDSIINDATTIIEMMAPAKVSEGGDDDDDLFFF